MKKIIHFHFDTEKNIGDDAVVFTIRYFLKRMFSSIEYTSRPIFYLSDIDFNVFFSEKIKNSKTIFNKLHSSKFLAGALTSLMKITKEIKGSSRKQLISLINNHDMMIVGGGGVYSKWTLPFDMELIKNVKIPIVIWGAGYNHNYTDRELSIKELKSLKYLSDKAKLCSVRDKTTLDLLESLKCDAVLTGDIAILGKSRKINIKFDNKTLKIGLNISNHESHTINTSEKILNAYTSLIKKLGKEYTVQLYYLKHSIQEKMIIRRLKKIFPNMIICDFGFREMKYVYENIDIVISMMLHSSIFAYSSSTKFINISYDEKNIAFMKLINNSHNMIDLRDFNFSVLNTKFMKLLESSNSRVLKKEYFEKEQYKFMDDIKRL